MKKLSFQRPNTFSRIPKGPFLGLAVALLALIFFSQIFPNTFASLTRSLFQSGTDSAQTNTGLFAVMSDRAQLTATVDSLTAERDQLLEEVVQLRSRLSMSEIPEGAESVAGAERFEVIARPPVASYDTYLIETGSEKVVQGAYVFSLGGTPLGVIEEVMSTRARVRLYSTGGATREAFLGDSKHTVQLVGRGAGTFVATVAKDVPVAVGDTVYVSAPTMRPIGSVAAIITNETEPESLLTVRPYTNIFNQAYVLVQGSDE